ncbi:hypothetical protein LTR84_011148 [Exophiala bonariae]|uniref:FAS1 domain-containing protein n=1 Tax=Exophiala bonariae TaxID=1690606 RepID=A0AAV9NIV2_9EURO|nr:hypothetical protein LTR84_011148 [Exophiala bonariae]
MRHALLAASIFSSLSLAAAIYPFDAIRNSGSTPSPLIAITNQPDHEAQAQQQNPIMPVDQPDQPSSSSSGPSAENPNPDPSTSSSTSTLSISDILPQTRKINIFASLTRDIDSVTTRLDSTNPSSNTTLLAPLNSAMQSLPRKPWEDRPGDDSSVRAESNEDKAAGNLARFVLEHVVPVSPWLEGRENALQTLGGRRLWWEWERRDGEKVRVVKPGDLIVDEVVGRVGNGEVWAVKGVVNYE